MVIYLLENDLHKAAFSDPNTAVKLAIKLVEADVKAKHPVRQIFSDYGGPSLLYVECFDENAVTAYVEAMKVNRKIVLHVHYPHDDIVRETVIHKLILEESSNATKCN